MAFRNQIYLKFYFVKGFIHKYQTQLRVLRKLKKNFVTNFCVSELQTLQFLTQKETIVIQISAALPSLNFHSGKSYVEKITVFTFQQFMSTSHVKLRSLNQKLQVWVFCFQGSHQYIQQGNCSEKSNISFLSLISLKTVLPKAKLDILDVCICKYIYIKEKLS